MTRRRDLETHRRTLDEIRGIMNSMKTLAYMETRKLARFLDAQQAVVRSVEAAAADLLAFYPELLPAVGPGQVVCLVVGSERGFCGDFNHALLRQLEDWSTGGGAGPEAKLFVVGRRLATLLERAPNVLATLAGASVVEEVFDLLTRLVTELKTRQAQDGGFTLYCLYHESEGPVVKPLLPPFRAAPDRSDALRSPPELNLDPRRLLTGLSEHYLFGALHLMVYTSLMAENRTRLSHLEGAVDHLDDELQDLGRRYNTLRQEQIIEEIEVILLSAAGATEAGRVSGR